jgi:hypothetical protein
MNIEPTKATMFKDVQQETFNYLKNKVEPIFEHVAENHQRGGV